jgi:O-antigen/teichoic acid export membrane protein
MNLSILRSKLGIEPDHASGAVRLRKARITSVAQIADRVTNVLVKLVSIPLAIAVLGQESYGVWLTLLSIMAWFSMGDLGLPSALTNPLVAAFADDDSKAARELITTTSYALLTIGLVLSAICIVLVLCLPIEMILGMSQASFNPDVRWSAISIAVLNIGLLFLRLPDVISFALQRGYYSSTANIFSQLVSLAGLIFLRLYGGSLLSFALCFLLPPILVKLILWRILYRHYGNNLLPRLENWSTQVLKAVWHDGTKFFSGMWAELLVLQTPNVIVARTFGAATVPVFAVTYQLFYSAFTLLNTHVSPLWPAYAEANSKQDYLWLRRTHWRMIKESLMLAIVGFTLLGLTSKWLVRIWAGEAVVPSSAFNWTLVAHFIQWSWNYVFVILLTGMGLIRERVQSVWLLGPVNIFMSIILANAFGTTGLVVGMALAMLFTQSWFLLWVTFKKLPWIFNKSHVTLASGLPY